jgi:hypothetical protein
LVSTSESLWSIFKLRIIFDWLLKQIAKKTESRGISEDCCISRNAKAYCMIRPPWEERAIYWTRRSGALG